MAPAWRSDHRGAWTCRDIPTAHGSTPSIRQTSSGSFRGWVIAAVRRRARHRAAAPDPLREAYVRDRIKPLFGPPFGLNFPGQLIAIYALSRLPWPDSPAVSICLLPVDHDRRPDTTNLSVHRWPLSIGGTTFFGGFSGSLFRQHRRACSSRPPSRTIRVDHRHPAVLASKVVCGGHTPRRVHIDPARPAQPSCLRRARGGTACLITLITIKTDDAHPGFTPSPYGAAVRRSSRPAIQPPYESA